MRKKIVAALPVIPSERGISRVMNDLPRPRKIGRFLASLGMTIDEMRKKIVAANWKMNMTQGESAQFLESFLRDIGEINDVEVVIIPPFTAIPKVSRGIRQSAQHQGRRAKYVLGKERRVYR